MIVTTLKTAARTSRRSEQAAALGLLCGYAVMAGAVWLSSPWFFITGAATAYTGDWYLHRTRSRYITLLRKGRLGVSIRSFLRRFLLLLLLTQTMPDTDAALSASAAFFLVLLVVQICHGNLATLTSTRFRPAVITQNTVHGQTAPQPPKHLISQHAEKMDRMDIPAVSGILIAVMAQDIWPAAAGMTASLLGATVYLMLLWHALHRAKNLPATDELIASVNFWLAAHAPETVLYFSGSKKSAYQINMWLRTAEQLHTRTLVVLRERTILNALAPTTLPVICVPAATHLMRLDFSTVRVALYPANVGKNIHFLRIPTTKHAFIGHGDSDKAASFNPFCKAYDQVWVAGPAGRTRYAQAAIGVRDENITEVGRPQLSGIQTAASRIPAPVPTVLYAPTWEGWTDEPGNTSLLLAGENLVRSLLSSDRPVRVLYRPHPFTGIRDPRASAAHRRIVALIEEAARERRRDPRWKATPVTDAARSLLDRIEAQTTALERTRRLQPEHDSSFSLRIRRLHEARSKAFWQSVPPWEHQVITTASPALHDCFNQADALLSDVSSVVSDFLASGKPYAVTDSAGLGPDEFRRRHAAARAAIVVTNDAGGMDLLLDAVLDPSADALSTARQDLRAFLLGPTGSDPFARINEAVARLAREADQRNLRIAPTERNDTPADTKAAMPGAAHSR